jgi:hypothetical protein
MGFIQKVMRHLTVLIAALFLLQTASCGTIIYPERRGQRSGRIDVGIAVLDGLGLLLFLIPGVIAFAVDFSTGAIYLPGGKTRTARGAKDSSVAEIKMNPKNLTFAKLDKVLSDYTGKEIKLQANTVLIYEADDHKNIDKQLKDLARYPVARVSL